MRAIVFFDRNKLIVLPKLTMHDIIIIKAFIGFVAFNNQVLAII